MKTLIFFALVAISPLSFGGQSSLSRNTVDCDPHGFTCKEGSKWEVTPYSEISRRISEAIRIRGHQYCSNGGRAAQEFDGFLRCEDTFVKKTTGVRCEDDRGVRFVCLIWTPQAGAGGWTAN